MLLWLAPLVLPLIAVLGYLVAVARARTTPAHNGALPRWSARQLGDGARLLMALLAYGWPALLAFATLPAGALFLGGRWAGTTVASVVLALADGLQPLGLAWLLATALLFPLLIRLATAGSLAATLSPRGLLALVRQQWRALPRLWLRELALLSLALLGLFVALVGYAFTLFWALLGIAALAAELPESAW